eukprot:scaffold177515_cov23-Tisochrysis_lutea.AAC.1
MWGRRTCWPALFPAPGSRLPARSPVSYFARPGASLLLQHQHLLHPWSRCRVAPRPLPPLERGRREGQRAREAGRQGRGKPQGPSRQVQLILSEPL